MMKLYSIPTATFDRSGASVSYAGDVNGDGIDDVIIGAYYADSNGNTRAGSSYVVLGSDAGFNPTVELSSLDGRNGFTINGVGAFDENGRSVSHAGDVNGDGIDDVIIGAPANSSNPKDQTVSSSFVVFGSNASFNPTVELFSLNGGNGFAITGVRSGDRSGASVGHAGDVNGDGIDDVIIGANRAGPNVIGNSYVVFGSDVIFKNGFE